MENLSCETLFGGAFPCVFRGRGSKSSVPQLWLADQSITVHGNCGVNSAPQIGLCDHPSSIQNPCRGRKEGVLGLLGRF